MEPFKRLTAQVIALDRANVDTDQIIPKQFLKLTGREGFGQYLFYDWRYHPDGRPREDFILNQERYKGARILLTRANFGCGSSREHAVWALKDYGFRAIIAPSFADIFYNNCFSNGLLPVVLPEEQVDELFKEFYATDRYTLTIDLEQQVVVKPDGTQLPFQIEEYKKRKLLEGLDDIGLTLRFEAKIREYERRRLQYLDPQSV
jgi:3-isopropylmalate/(R)-2-methylmalate dehydratase small subunit